VGSAEAGGEGEPQLSKKGVRWDVMRNALLFVAGFSILFVALGGR
jgi:cytochrome c biogenesis protein CcdA